MTKDNILVPIDHKTIKKLGIDNYYISSNTFSKLKKLNIGTKAKYNSIISLEELLKIYKNDYTIFINIIPSSNNFYTIIKTISKTIFKNPHLNFFISSSNIELLNYLILEIPEAKKGIFINNNSDWNYSVDFYVVNSTDINNNIILTKLNNNQIVFINIVDNINNIKKNIITSENIYIIN